ncbi:hypothetical protein PV433_03465 [Paenibacillus sp. GYB004]|uniref:hypothetical protein n=1 Tax=Paenibacillus sp. GYB004 TaxID=2994393 RepID=UPI002F9614E4
MTLVSRMARSLGSAWRSTGTGTGQKERGAPPGRQLGSLQRVGLACGAAQQAERRYGYGVERPLSDTSSNE